MGSAPIPLPSGLSGEGGASDSTGSRPVQDGVPRSGQVGPESVRSGLERILDGSAGSPPADPADGPALPDLPIRPVEPDPQSGIRLTRAVDCAFRYQPDSYPDGAMVVRNETGRPLSLSLHDLQGASCLVNGRPAAEGQRFSIVTELVISGTGPCGIHVRTPRSEDRPPAGDGNG